MSSQWYSFQCVNVSVQQTCSKLSWMAFCSSVTAEAALSSASCCSVWLALRLRCSSHTWTQQRESSNLKFGFVKLVCSSCGLEKAPRSQNGKCLEVSASWSHTKAGKRCFDGAAELESGSLMTKITTAHSNTHTHTHTYLFFHVSHGFPPLFLILLLCFFHLQYPILQLLLNLLRFLQTELQRRARLKDGFMDWVISSVNGHEP